MLIWSGANLSQGEDESKLVKGRGWGQGWCGTSYGLP